MKSSGFCEQCVGVRDPTETCPWGRFGVAYFEAVVGLVLSILEARLLLLSNRSYVLLNSTEIPPGYTT